MDSPLLMFAPMNLGNFCKISMLKDSNLAPKMNLVLPEKILFLIY